ncbi:hypothetical protein BZA05DRAFT_443639 [Tricharina praecox]|uniref:uncharacterized protein n=1 Tax=Tricharina praecox TaxID=43433 RepID=UPI002221051B|nr:uncharacterized protein BZA05DRAFT_443639 [Tricharina praecox]KAI5854117.1 hypothetical protein BZA05DRAFT_443639 [Tricharina praecox]
MPTTTSFTGPHPPRTPGARGENMRVRLTKPEKLEIMKMCVEHGAEYSVPGGRGAFWEKIAQLASEKTGRDVRNPSQMVRKLLDMYIAGVGRTGELGVCMEAWKKRVDESGDGRGVTGLKRKRRISEMSTAQAVGMRDAARGEDDTGDTEDEESPVAPQRTVTRGVAKKKSIATTPSLRQARPRGWRQQFAEAEARRRAQKYRDEMEQRGLDGQMEREIAHVLQAPTDPRMKILKNATDHSVGPQPQPQPPRLERSDMARIADCIERIDKAMDEIKDNTRAILAVLKGSASGGHGMMQ